MLIGSLLACGGSGNEEVSYLESIADDIDLSPTCGTTHSNESCEVFIFPSDSSQKREYILHLPQGEIETSPPLFIFLHGGGGSAATTPLFFGIRAFLKNTNYIGVFPNARLNERGFRSWDFDDVEFVDEVIRRVNISHNIDLQRVYVFGYSNGGFLANYLACKIPSKVTSIMSHAGNLLAPLDDPINSCEKDDYVAIAHIHATDDDIIFYEGTEEGFLSAEEAIREWSIQNQCDDSFTLSNPIDLVFDEEGTDSTTRTYENCLAPVQLTTIEGSTHLPDFDLEELSSLMQEFYEESN